MQIIAYSRSLAGIHTSSIQCDVNDALKLKEATQIDNKLILQPQEQEQKRRLAKYITITEASDISTISGVPLEHIKGRFIHSISLIEEKKCCVPGRRVKIAQSVKNAMQSGTDNVGTWQLSFETRERWENPLMGWSST